MQPLLLALLVGCSYLSASEPVLPPTPEDPVPTAVEHVAEVVSNPYHIDKRFMSMTGPHGFNEVHLGGDGPEELVWITGYHTEVVRAEDQGKLSQEYMCHANLDFDAAEYYKKFPTQVPLSGRVFTLSQGQQEIRFPKGMGVPVSSKLPLSLATQVLNLNQDEIDLKVQHKVQIYYIRDSELDVPMKPLFQGAVEGFKALEDAHYYGVDQSEADADALGQGCSIGQAAIAGDFDEDRLGQKFTAHWVVPPGREVNVTNVTRFLNLPFDTTAHYIAVHLHPFAESLELRDLTLDKTVYKAAVKNSENRVGIDEIEFLASREGVMLYKDHEYELISVYNNTSDDNADSMAVMYLYLLDKEFQKPSFAKG